MSWTRVLASLVLGTAVAVAACSSSVQGGGSCTNDYSGTWQLRGSCESGTCTATQNGCSVSVSCGSGTLTGSISGNAGSFTGTSPRGESTSCSATFSGANLELSCNTGNGTCSSTGTCTQGACGKALPSGTPSTGATLACKQKADADTGGDCDEHPGKPRKLDCDDGQTEAAIAAGCERETPTGSDVCCPTTVSGTKPPPTGIFDGGTSSGNDSGTSSGVCSTSYGGTWRLTGTCEQGTCSASQSGCNLTVSCGSGARLSGSVTGTTASLSGTSAAGTSASCLATFSGANINLSCSSSGVTCTSSGTCSGGACGGSSEQ